MAHQKKLVKGFKTAGKLAVGLTVKGVKTAKKGVKVVGGLLLKPVFLVIGSKLKMLGAGLKVVGAKTKVVGTALKTAGKVVKAKGLGSVGFGATAIGWGTDASTLSSLDDRSQSSTDGNQLPPLTYRSSLTNNSSPLTDRSTDTDPNVPNEPIREPQPQFQVQFNNYYQSLNESEFQQRFN